MKNKILNVVLSMGAFASLSIPLATMTSCNQEQHELKGQVIENKDWKLDFVYQEDGQTKTSASYRVNLDNFTGGEKVKISIASAVDEGGEIIDYLEIKDGSETTIAANQEHLSFSVTSKDLTKFVSGKKYFFSIKAIVEYFGQTLEFVFADYQLDVAKATTEENFKIEENVLKSFKSGSDYEDCTLFVLPEGVTSIADGAFYDSELSKTLIPESMKYIMLDGSWGKNEPTLKTIGKKAFYGAPFVGDIYIPKSVETIDDNAFRECGFTKFYVGINPTEQNSLKKIGTYAFLRTNFSGDLVIPEGTETIGDWAFYKSKISGKVYLPSTLKQMHTGNEGGAFRECPNIKGVEFANGCLANSGVDYVSFFNCNRISELYLPDGIKYLGQESFRSCQDLKKISLPNLPTVKEGGAMRMNCFSGEPNLSTIDLTRVVNPDSVVFKGGNIRQFVVCCDNVETVTIILADIEPIHNIGDEIIIQHFADWGLPKDKIVLEYAPAKY